MWMDQSEQKFVQTKRRRKLIEFESGLQTNVGGREKRRIFEKRSCVYPLGKLDLQFLRLKQYFHPKVQYRLPLGNNSPVVSDCAFHGLHALERQ